MITEVANRDVVSTYVRAVQDRLKAGHHDDAAERAAKQRGLHTRDAHSDALLFASKLPDDGLGEETEPQGEEPFISREPLVSLIQTSLEAHLRSHGMADETAADHPHHGLFSHFSQTIRNLLQRGGLAAHAAETAGEIAEGFLTRLEKGWHPFNDAPADLKIDDDHVRLIVVGDWGSGLKQAGAVAGLMAQEVQAGLKMDRKVHVIHLGDVYFAGEAEEYRDHVLANGWWPVTTEQANAGVGSWALAGNHDLYGGARAYFDVQLADPRFKLQRSNDSKPTSWFRLTTPSWEIIGLDTSWNDDLFQTGQTGLLQDPQAATIAEWVAADQQRDAAQRHKRLLLSHHQFLTVYDSRLTTVLGQGKQPALHQKISDIVNEGAVTAWIWGHEHRCMAFADDRISSPRCLGHGGQLQQAHTLGTKPSPPGTWEETAQFEYAGLSWARFGFAVLDLHDGGQIDVAYHLDGAQPGVAGESFG